MSFFDPYPIFDLSPGESERVSRLPSKYHHQEHWFIYDDCCVVAHEYRPGSHWRKTLFFLHGRFGHAETWAPVIGALGNQYRCICVDLPGFGRSFSAGERGLHLLEHGELVSRLVKHFESQVVLVGHDIGGAIAQICALQNPEMTVGLVLVDCSPLTETANGLEPGLFGWRAKWTFRRLKLEARSLPAEAFETLSVSRRMEALRGLQESWPGQYERQVWRKAIRGLRVPVLLLWGERDGLNPMEIGVRMMHELPEAYLFSDEGSGHWPNLENPEWVVVKMREFIFKLTSVVESSVAMR